MEAFAGYVQNGHAGGDGGLRGELSDEDQAESGRRAKAAAGAGTAGGWQSRTEERGVGWVRKAARLRRKAARLRSFGSRQTSPLAHDDRLRRGGFAPRGFKVTPIWDDMECGGISREGVGQTRLPKLP